MSNYPKAVLIISTSSVEKIGLSNNYISCIQKRFTELLTIVCVNPNQTKDFEFQYFGLDGEVNPISGSFEVTKDIVEKLSNEEQKELYKALHAWGHRIY